MPYCPKCGTKVENNDRFCSSCGNELEKTVSSVSAPTSILFNLVENSINKTIETSALGFNMLYSMENKPDKENVSVEVNTISIGDIVNKKINDAKKSIEEQQKVKQAEIGENNAKREVMIKKLEIMDEHLSEWSDLRGEIILAENKLEAVERSRQKGKIEEHEYDAKHKQLLLKLEKLQKKRDELCEECFFYEIPDEYLYRDDFDRIKEIATKSKVIEIDDAIQKYTQKRIDEQKKQEEREHKKQEKQLEHEHKKQEKKEQKLKEKQERKEEKKNQPSYFERKKIEKERRQYNEYMYKLETDEKWKKASWIPGVKAIDTVRRAVDAIDNPDRYIDPLYMKAKKDFKKEQREERKDKLFRPLDEVMADYIKDAATEKAKEVGKKALDSFKDGFNSDIDKEEQDND